MSDDISKTIEVLTARVTAKEEEANKLKKLVNELCSEAGIEARYSNIPKTGSALTFRTDDFYGQTLTAAIRNYLERRKASGLGAASVSEVYASVRDGGYEFETNNEDNAQTSVRNALRKSSSIFHKLPNGQYGLLIWYPSAKAPQESERSIKTKGQDKTHLKTKASTESHSSGAEKVTQAEITGIILGQSSEFQASEIEAAVKAKFPGRPFPKTKIPSVLFILKKQKGLLREVSPRIGKKGAVYVKI